MEDDFTEYQRLKDREIPAEAALQWADENDSDIWFKIRMLRAVYRMDLADAKELTVLGSSSETKRKEYYSMILEALEMAFEEIDLDSEP